MLVKFQNTKNKDKILKLCVYGGEVGREGVQTGKQKSLHRKKNHHAGIWFITSNAFTSLKEPRILSQTIYESELRIKMFSDMKRFRKFSSHKLFNRKLLKYMLQKSKGIRQERERMRFRIQTRPAIKRRQAYKESVQTGVRQHQNQDLPPRGKS